MSDIMTAWADGLGDWAVDAGQLADDEGLRTAVVLSLFSDAPATDDDIGAGLTDERRGWWGNAVSDGVLGSRLWLLRRAKLTEAPAQRAREYAAEALQWLVDDGVVERIVTAAEIAAPGVLGLVIELHRPRKPPLHYRFESTWRGQ